MRNILFSFVMLTPACAVAEAPAPKPPVWLAGYWLSCEGDRQTVEVWIADETGALVGMNQSVGSFEHLRIATTDEGYAYVASPGGAPSTSFLMKRDEKERAVFENPTHDFPQRVLYSRDGDELTARIEGVVNGKAESMQWRFRSAAIGERCRDFSR